MARAFTGRDRILKFEGGWHGLSDYALHSSKPPKPGDYPHGVPDSAGIPKSVTPNVLVSPFNHIDKAKEIIEKLKEKNITLARRTIAKYRKEFGILPSNLRRKF